jgi:alkylhydroperoxidase family enzyme
MVCLQSTIANRQSEDLMALVKLIDETAATGKVKAIFEDIKATKGIDRVPNIWRALANHPDHLEVTWQKLKTIMRPGKLDLLTKEIIALSVSITNGCEY